MSARRRATLNPISAAGLSFRRSKGTKQKERRGTVSHLTHDQIRSGANAAAAVKRRARRAHPASAIALRFLAHNADPTCLLVKVRCECLGWIAACWRDRSHPHATPGNICWEPGHTAEEVARHRSLSSNFVRPVRVARCTSSGCTQRLTLALLCLRAVMFPTHILS